MRLAERLLIIIAALSLLAGCSGSGRPDDNTSDASDVPLTSRPPFGTMPALPGGSAHTGSRADIPDAAWSAILADLDALLDDEIDPSEIDVVSVQEMTWNNGALGCPQPGQVYTQALVDGLRIVVAVDGTEYDYRVTGSTVRLCR